MAGKKTLAAKLLYKFLKKKRALKAYIDNVMKQDGDHDDVKKLYEKSDILGIIDLYEASIYSSFTWDYTKEGVWFWDNLHLEFMQFKEEQFFGI